MDAIQKQALAHYFEQMSGGEALASALALAASLSPGGKLTTESFWREVIGEPDQAAETDSTARVPLGTGS